MRRIHWVRGVVMTLALTGCSDVNGKSPPAGPPVRVPSSIVITPTTATMRGVGSSATLTANVFAADGGVVSGVEPTWSSDLPNIASVTASGLSAVVTAVAPGAARITAFAGNVSATASITVEAVVRRVTIQSPPVTMEPGDRVTLRATVTADPGLATTVRWTSSAVGIVSVSTDGVASALANGDAIVTATSTADETQMASASIRVEVYHAATLFTAGQFLPGSFPAAEVTALWSSGASAHLAATGAGEVYAYSGTRWSRVLDGIRPQYPNLPNGPEVFMAFGGTSVNDIWAVGSLGAIAHFDGASWSRTGQAVPWSLESVWATSRSDVWAVGTWGTMLHFDGSQWNTVATDWNGTWSSVPRSRYRSVWATGPANVYAGVLSGTNRLDRYDGQSWTPVTLPSTGFSTLVDHLTGTGPADVFAVMRGGPILRYDGTSWQRLAEPSGASYECGWGMNGSNGAAGNVAACNVTGAGGRLLEMKSGGIASSRALPRSAEPPQAVATAPDGSVIVGYADGATYLWTNGAWKMLSASPHLASVQMKGPTTAFATAGSSIAEYDGANWSLVALPTTSWMAGLWVSSPTLAYAVGMEGVVIRYDGSRWSQVSHQMGRPELYDVWGAAPDAVWAVGQMNNVAVIATYDGGSWRATALAGSAALLGVWGSSSRDVFAVGSQGTIAHFNGTAWTRSQLAVPVTLHDVWGTGPTDVYAVGQDGVIAHFDGRAWSIVRAPLSDDLMSIWGSGPRDLYAVSRDAVLPTSEDGVLWTRAPIAGAGAGDGLMSITGTRAGGLLAVGTGGLVVHGTRPGAAALARIP